METQRDNSEEEYERLSDSVLIPAIRSGNEPLFKSLYLNRHKALLEFAYRYVRDTDIAEEIVQDVFLNLWINKRTWFPSSSIDAYLFGAVRNRAMNVGRARGTLQRNNRDIVALYDRGIESDSGILRSEVDTMVNEAIARLSERSRDAIILRWIHSMTYADIANVMETTEDAARKLVKRGLNQLSELLEKLRD